MNNQVREISENLKGEDELSSEEKLDQLADVFHAEIDDIVIQLKKGMMIDEDLLPYNLLRRLIFMTINVYGFEDINTAIEKFLDEALSYAEQTIQ